MGKCALKEGDRLHLARMSLIALSSLSALFFCSIALLAWRRRRVALSRAVLFLSVSVAVYAFGYACELASNTLPMIYFWLHIENLGIAFIPTAWIMLAVCHTRTQWRHWPLLQVALIVVSMLSVIFSNTSEFHNLYYMDLHLNPAAPFPVAAFTPGIWYVFHNVFINVAAVVGNILYIRQWKKAVHPQAQQQAFAFFISSLFPWLVVLIYIFGASPWGLDPMPIAFLVPGALYGWAISTLKLFAVAPIAQELIFQRLEDAIIVFDREGRLADFNAAGQRVFPELKDSIKGHDGAKAFSPYREMLAAFEMPPGSVKTLCRHQGEMEKCYQIRRVDLHDDGGWQIGYMMILHDITSFSRLVDGLQLQATTDPLTGAYNRNILQERAQELLENFSEASPGALLITDLDRFKGINDIYGHLAGDTALTEFSAVCARILREQDFFCRYGGDEFVILLPETEEKVVFELAESIRRELERLDIRLGLDQSIKLTASIGAAMRQKSDPSIEVLLKRADEALYEAKRAGGNCVRIF